MRRSVRGSKTDKDHDNPPPPPNPFPKSLAPLPPSRPFSPKSLPPPPPCGSHVAIARFQWKPSQAMVQCGRQSQVSGNGIVPSPGSLSLSLPQKRKWQHPRCGLSGTLGLCISMLAAKKTDGIHCTKGSATHSRRVVVSWHFFPRPSVGTQLRVSVP
jgi:hypothetical protein